MTFSMTDENDIDNDDATFTNSNDEDNNGMALIDREIVMAVGMLPFLETKQQVEAFGLSSYTWMLWRH